MPGKIPSQMTFTLLSAAAIAMDTLVKIDSNGKAVTAGVNDDFDGVALSGCGAAGAEVSIDPGEAIANLTITGTCSAGDLLSIADAGGVKKFVGTAGRTVTVANATDIWTLTAHGFVTGERVRLTNSGGALPANASATTDYYVSVIDADTFKLYTSQANAVAAGATGLLDVSGDGTGTQSIRLYGDTVIVGKAIEAAATTGQKVAVLQGKRNLLLP